MEWESRVNALLLQSAITMFRKICMQREKKNLKDTSPELGGGYGGGRGMKLK